jgi:hypothetical protein
VFWAHAIARQDGGKSDGIHLLWAPPRWAGYSLDGFDIWRRESREQGRPTCYELTSGDLTALHTSLRVVTPPAFIGVRLAPCPGPPDTIPDEPYSQKVPGRERDSIGTRVRAAEEGATRAEETWGRLLSSEATRHASDLLRAHSHEHDPLHRALERAASARAASGDTRPGSTPNVPSLVRPPAIAVHPGAAQHCLLYDFRLRRPCALVQVRFDPYGGWAVALRDGKAIDARAMTPSGTGAQAEFAQPGIDRVLVWVAVAPRAIRICCHDDDKREDWHRAELIARHLQFPLREIEPAVSDVAGELALAKSRLLPGEDLGPGQFGDLSATMNEALRDPHTSPAYRSRMARSTEAQDYMEVQPWSTGLAMTIDASWRRALGLGFLDRGEGLTAGERYDYRIVGRFRRRDAEERLLGFHTVPLGTPLPRVLYLGGLRLDFGGEREVVAHPKIPAHGLGHGFRKGVQLDGRTTLAFATPIERLVLELQPDTVNLHYRALSGGLIPGISLEVASGTVPALARAELMFPDPVARLQLDGRALLYGVRLELVAPGVDPEQIIELDAVVSGVRYEPTAAPPPPPVLGTVNLQTPLAVGDPAVTTRQPPNLIGFKLWWLPPPSGTWPVGWWPPDLPAAPPMEVLAFDVERRRVDTASAWQPFDVEPETGLGTLVGAARGGREDPVPLRPGDELLEHFPEVRVPVPPVPVLADLEDVLVSRAKPEGPPPGSLHQYRIRSVDAIGRRSTAATVGSVVRLEKRLPPPHPPGPPIAAGETRPLPRGVRARLLQAIDPDLPAEDRARLMGHSSAVLLEWGWGDEERRADPWAREFRLYWQPMPPDLIDGTFTGAATQVAGRYEIAATLSHGVTADQFAGEFVRAGAHPFQIASHDGGAAGSTLVFRLEPSALAITPTPVPGPGPFRLRPTLNGEELQPPAWLERSAVVPIDARTQYEHLLTTPLTLDAQHPRVRVWVGVSAADDQAYIDDVLPAGASHGGRPGNESSIVAATAEGRWLGRPSLDVPPPLPDVPEIMIPEVPGDEVDHDVDLPGLVSGVPHPPGSRFRLERLSGADLLAALSAQSDDSLQIALPDGTSADYAVANPGDRAALLAQVRSGEPARVENRFLMDLAIKFNPGLAPLWRPALPAPTGFTVVRDRVSNKAERFLYRLRAVDAAGHVSEGVAFVPRIFRVPARRIPAVPQLVRLTPNGDHAEAVLRTGSRFDLAGVLLFWLTEDGAAADPTRLDKPHLLRVPNSPNLYPTHGIRLRLSDGTLLAPQFAPSGAAAVADSVLTWTLDQSTGHGRRVTLWAAALTRDGVPSPVAGPLTSATGEAPPPVPVLTVSTSAGHDQLTWPAQAAEVSVRLERTTDGGATWVPVSPWFGVGITAHTLQATAPGREYRLRVRRGNQEVTGAATPLP